MNPLERQAFAAQTKRDESVSAGRLTRTSSLVYISLLSLLALRFIPEGTDGVGVGAQTNIEVELRI